MHEYESEFDIEISQDNSYANALVCKDRMDDSMKSLLAKFEVLIFMVSLSVFFVTLFFTSCLTILKNRSSLCNIELGVSLYMWLLFYIACLYSFIYIRKCRLNFIKNVNHFLAKFYEIFGIQGDDDRKSWASFQARISKAPEQVLR